MGFVWKRDRDSLWFLECVIGVVAIALLTVELVGHAS